MRSSPENIKKLETEEPQRLEAEEAKGLDLEHWWGSAALPEDAMYPENGEGNPLTLICQFHYGEGLISVMADVDYFLGDMDAESGGIGPWPERMYKVIYSPSRTGLQLHTIAAEDGAMAVPEAEPLDAPASRGESSHIWGEPICFSDEVRADYPGYVLLLELDESDAHHLRFYDCGALFFLIAEEDLAQKRFDRVVCAMYCF